MEGGKEEKKVSDRMGESESERRRRAQRQKKKIGSERR